MPSYAEFFLNSERSVVQLECLKISHPDFTQDYYRVRNARSGVTVTHENAGGDFAYSYLPMRISQLGTKDDLDTGIRVNFGDLGEVLPREIDAIDNADGYPVRPSVEYRIYRSDDLTAPMYGPLKLQVKTLSFNGTGVSFDAIPPQLNNSKTGEVYSFERFPMLRGFV